MDICVGNLPKDVTARDLREIFEFFGRVATAHLVRPRPGEESKGLGFVGMPVREEAVSAVLGVHGKTVQGQAITANEVQPKGPVSGVCGTRCPCRAGKPGRGRYSPSWVKKGGQYATEQVFRHRVPEVEPGDSILVARHPPREPALEIAGP